MILGIFWFLRDPFREIELALSIFLLRDIKTVLIEELISL